MISIGNMIKFKFERYLLNGSFFIMCISVFFLRWYINSSLVVYIACFSTLILTIFRSKEKFKFKDIIVLFILLIYVSLNLLFTSNHTYFFDDFVYHTLFPMSILIFFTNYFNSNFNLKKFITYFFYLINIYYIINNYIVLKQINVPGFMIRNFSDNNFYLDQISGFFGTNGTHKLCIFFIVSLYLNILFFKSNNKINRVISKIMFLYILITSIYVSSYNDNRIYFILLILFLLPFLYKNINIKILKNRKKLASIIIIVCSLIVSIFFLYNTNESFKLFVNNDIYEKYILKTFNRFNNVNSTSNKKGEERIELTIYALEKGNGLFLGKGIGSIITYSDPNLPKHFGLNESTLRIYTGGISYLFLLIYVYYHHYSKIIKKEKNNLLLKLYLFGTITFLSLYSRIFTNFDETFLISIMYIFIISYICDYKFNNNEYYCLKGVKNEK